MRNGGTILFDTRDLTLGAVHGPSSPGEQTLRRLLGKLDLPPLAAGAARSRADQGVLSDSDFPGRWDGGQVWVESLPPGDRRRTAPARGGDGVSPVIIGGNDWAAAWAVDAVRAARWSTCRRAAKRQREMAIRFGINVVMYALTGNYKTDQVHVPRFFSGWGNRR